MNGAKWAFPVSRFLSDCAPPPLPPTTESNQPFSTCCWPSALRPTWGWCIWPSRWVTVMQWAAAPRRHCAALHKRVSEYLPSLIDAAADSAPFGLPPVMKPQSDTSVRGCWRWRCCFRTTSCALACRETGTAVSLSLRMFLSCQQVALWCGSWFTSGPLSVTVAATVG